MDETIEKYAIKKENDDSKSLLSKDKAYLAAGKIVEKFKQLQGIKNLRFLDRNFLKIWEDHDGAHKNTLDAGEAQLFMQELVEAE